MAEHGRSHRDIRRAIADPALRGAFPGGATFLCAHAARELAEHPDAVVARFDPTEFEALAAELAAG